jgi:DNA-directed RNA polymerase subunit RPC12/RpoP
MKNRCEECGHESEEGKQLSYTYADGDVDLFFICSDCESKLQSWQEKEAK